MLSASEPLPCGPYVSFGGHSARLCNIHGDANSTHIWAVFASPRTTRSLRIFRLRGHKRSLHVHLHRIVGDALRSNLSSQLHPWHPCLFLLEENIFLSGRPRGRLRRLQTLAVETTFTYCLGHRRRRCWRCWRRPAVEDGWEKITLCGQSYMHGGRRFGGAGDDTICVCAQGGGVGRGDRADCGSTVVRPGVTSRTVMFARGKPIWIYPRLSKRQGGTGHQDLGASLGHLELWEEP
jgi:hypothetical protein